MHREILGIAEAGRTVLGDHIDGNTLDNRRQNLRCVTPSQSVMNRGTQKNNASGVTGVRFDDAAGRWVAIITVNRKQLWLGAADTIEEAARLRLEGERKYFGRYARRSA